MSQTCLKGPIRSIHKNFAGKSCSLTHAERRKNHKPVIARLVQRAVVNQKACVANVGIAGDCVLQLLWDDKVVDAFQESSRSYRRLSRNELGQRRFFTASQRHRSLDDSNNLAWASGTVSFHGSYRSAESSPFPELTLVVKETTMDSFDPIICRR